MKTISQKREETFIALWFALMTLLFLVYAFCLVFTFYGAGDYMIDWLFERESTSHVEAKYLISGGLAWYLHKRVVRFVKTKIIGKR